MSLLLILDAFGAGCVIMAQFEEVLDEVRSALTWASPADIRALLEGLVEEHIISEAYSRSLNLHRFTDGVAPEMVFGELACTPGSEPEDVFVSRGSSTRRRHLSHGPLSQVMEGGSQPASDFSEMEGSEFVSSMDDYYSSRSGPQCYSLYEDQALHRNKLTQESRDGIAMDEHYQKQGLFSVETLFDCSLTLNNEITELLMSADSMQKLVSDSERVNQGNLEDEREWLEQIEVAARRIAVPLWQHWDKGRKMLLPLVPCSTSGCSTSENTATHSEAQCSILDMEQETELAAACRTLDACAGNFNASFTLDAEKAADTPEEFYFPTYYDMPTTGIDTDHFETFGEGRNASPVEDGAATSSDNNTSGGMDGFPDAWWPGDRTTETTDDLVCLTADVESSAGSELPQFTFPYLNSLFPSKDAPVTAQDSSFFSSTDSNMSAVLTEDVYRGAEVCRTDRATDTQEDIESLCGKFELISQSSLNVAYLFMYRCYIYFTDFCLAYFSFCN